MSLTRRLRRLLRAHLGSLRDDPLDFRAEPDASNEASESDAAGSDGSGRDVPSDVTKAYRALEVPVGSDREAVKKGYRRMMNRYHQDRFQNDDEKRAVAGEVSKRLNLAYDRVIEYLDDRGT